MKKNVGDSERILRAIVGLLFVGAGFYLGSWWIVLGLGAGLSLIGSALTGYCFLYRLMGKSTCPLSLPPK